MWKALGLRPVRRDGGIYERERRVCVCGGRKRNGKEKNKGDKRNERGESRRKKDNFVEITLKKLFVWNRASGCLW